MWISPLAGDDRATDSRARAPAVDEREQVFNIHSAVAARRSDVGRARARRRRTAAPAVDHTQQIIDVDQAIAAWKRHDVSRARVGQWIAAGPEAAEQFKRATGHWPAGIGLSDGAREFKDATTGRASATVDGVPTEIERAGPALLRERCGDGERERSEYR